MMGWTSDEYRLWLVPGGLLERVDRLGAVALAGAMARCHCGTEVPRGYRALHPEAGTAELVGQMVTDHLLRLPLHRIADARAGSSYVYEFAWPANLPGLGACHALELGFVFDTGDVPESRKLAGEGGPQHLADEMHAAWVRFATEGTPGWQPWDDTHPVRLFDASGPRVVHGPRDADLALWTAGPATRPPSQRPSPPPMLTAARPTELRSVVRRLRLPGSVRRQ
jgi:para-nitrobenzyl esterase